MKKININLFLAFILIFPSRVVFSTVRVTNASGNWNNAAIWTPAGVPSSGDMVTVNHAVTIPISSSTGSLTVSSSGSIHYVSGQSLSVYGYLTSAGGWFGTGYLFKYGGGTITATAPINNTGIYLRLRPGANKVVSIAAGSVLTVQSVALEALGTSGGVINNYGTIGLTTFSIDGNITFNNSANSSLTIPKNVSLTNGGIFTAKGNPNTVTYSGTNWTSVVATTYHHLLISNGAGTTIGTKNLAGDIIMNGNFTLASNVLLNCATHNITCCGIWTNNNPTSNLSNAGVVTFSGVNPSILRKTNKEVLGNVVVNCTGSFILNSPGTVGYTGNFKCNNLTINSATIDLGATQNYTVTINGNINGGGTNNKILNGMFMLSGTTAQTITSTSPISFSNITCSNSAGVSTLSAENLTGTLTVPIGTFTSDTADFTLISDTATGITARVDSLTTGSVAGNNWVVQRRINTSAPASSNPYYGDYSSPVTSATISDWDNEMYLYNVGGTDTFDNCMPLPSSVMEFEGTPDYTYDSTNFNLVPGNGYTIWTQSAACSMAPITLDTKGQLNSGNISHSCPAAGFYTMGNPYPSEILFGSLSKINIANYFYCLDDSAMDYATWDQTTGIGTNRLKGSGGVINSSQGFLCEALNAGSLSFTETNKTKANTAFVRMGAPVNMISFHFSNGKQQRGMENSIHFISDAKNEKDELDMGYPKAPFLKKRYQVKTLSADGKELCKNTVNLSDVSHEIPVVFIPAEQGVFTVSFGGLNDFSAYNCVFLEDISAGTFTDLKNQSSYTFKTENNNERRFVIHFKRTDGSAEACIMKSNIFERIAEKTPIAKVFANPSGIVMNFDYKEMTKVKVVIYNSIGEVISTTEQFYSEGQFILEKPVVQGIYLVNLTDGKRSETHRVFID